MVCFDTPSACVILCAHLCVLEFEDFARPIIEHTHA